jgi:hypothetical protein
MTVFPILPAVPGQIAGNLLPKWRGAPLETAVERIPSAMTAVERLIRAFREMFQKKQNGQQ